MRHAWRDCLGWREEGFKFNTTSNEACKLYDALLTQYCGLYEDNQLGGIVGTIQKMLDEDPDFIMGNVIALAFNRIASPGKITDEQTTKLKHLLYSKQKLYKTLSDFEIMHIDAVAAMCIGDCDTACKNWESILVNYPKDILALKLSNDIHFYTGGLSQLRDNVARVLPFWKPTTPLYGYLHGMFAFGLSQTNYLREARVHGMKALEINKKDSWATHSICHVNEYENAADEGIRFLRDTESDWSSANLFAGHNYWHLSLYHIEKNEHEEAMSIFDEIILPRVKKSKSYFDIVDACSFLYRLKLDDSKLLSQNSCEDNRWKELKEVCLTYADEHSYPLNDTHVLFGLSACNDEEAKKRFFDSLNGLVNDEINKNSFFKKASKVEIAVCKAIEYFDSFEFDKVVDLLYPIRYDLVKIGGSNAQRDIFHQMLTQAALRSNDEFYKKVGLSLINERKGLRSNSKLTERLVSRFASVHELY